MMILSKCLFVLLILTVVPVSAGSNQISSLEGHWTGIAIIAHDTTKFELELELTNGLKGRWSLPDNGKVRIPFQQLEFIASSGSLVGDSNFLNGKLSQDLLSGSLNWHGADGVFRLEKSKPPSLPYSEEEVTFFNGSVTLEATLVLPKSDGPHPGIVFLHGSGTSTRWWALYYAEHFARIGITSLIFDKRGSGSSGGNWVTSSLEDLAKDAVSAINYLKDIDNIDTGRIGLWGISQGGWVASYASTMTGDIAFMIVNSGGGVSPHDEELFSYRTALHHGGASENEIADAMELLEKYFDYLSSGKGRVELLQNIEDVRERDWYNFVAIDRILPSEENRPNWSWVANYNPLPDIGKMKFPILLLFGGNDTVQPTSHAVNNWEKGLKMANNKSFTIKVFLGANHGIRMGAHGVHRGGWPPKFADGYMKLQLDWLNEHIVVK